MLFMETNLEMAFLYNLNKNYSLPTSYNLCNSHFLKQNGNDSASENGNDSTE